MSQQQQTSQAGGLSGNLSSSVSNLTNGNQNGSTNGNLNGVDKSYANKSRICRDFVRGSCRRKNCRVRNFRSNLLLPRWWQSPVPLSTVSACPVAWAYCVLSRLSEFNVSARQLQVSENHFCLSKSRWNFVMNPFVRFLGGQKVSSLHTPGGRVLPAIWGVPTNGE